MLAAIAVSACAFEIPAQPNEVGGSDGIGATPSGGRTFGGSGMSGEAGLANQGGSSPVAQEATLHVVPATMPSTQIVAQTEKYWCFADYTFTVDSDGSPPAVTGACVAQDDPDGDMADVDAFMLASYTKGDSVASSEADIHDSVACFHFVRAQLVLTPGTTGVLDLAAHVAIPVPSSSVNGAWHGVPRSGHTPRFRLVTVSTKGGQIINIPAHETPQLVIRKSEPFVLRIPLASDVLDDGERELYQFQAAVIGPGSMALKQLQLWYTRQGAFTVSDIRVRRDGTDLPSDMFSAFMFDGPDIVQTIAGSMTRGDIHVIFANEEIIPIEGKAVYTIHATISGSALGDAFTMNISSDPKNQTTITGSLFLASSHPDAPLYDVRVGTGWDLYGAAFLWSDMSETPHSDLDMDHGGSADWTYEYLVPGIAEPQILRR